MKGSVTRNLLFLLLLIAYGILFSRNLDSLKYFHRDEQQWVRVGFIEFERYFIDRNYDYEAWEGSSIFTSASKFNPPAAKYIIGASLWLHGYRNLEPLPPWQEGKSVQWHLEQGLLPPADELRAARLPIAILGACTAVIVALIVWELLGSVPAAVVASLILAFNDNFAVHAHRAMLDVPALFFSAVVIYAVIKALRSARRSTAWVGVASLSMGLAVSSKMNTLLVYGVLGVAALWLARRAWKRHDVRCSAVTLFLAGLAPAAVFLALNPYLWHNTGRGLRSLFRLSQIVAGYRPNFPRYALYSLGDKMHAFAKFAFPPQGSAVSASDCMHLILFLAGAVVAARMFLRSQKGPLFGVLFVWGLIAFVGVVAWTPLAWDRYYLPWVPVAAVFEGIGAYWLLQMARQALRLAVSGEALDRRSVRAVLWPAMMAGEPMTSWLPWLRREEGGLAFWRNSPIPFLSTPFSFDLMLFLALWPLWWILGVEQILPPLFLAWETGRYLWQARGRFTLSAPVIWAGLLALWWLVPALWVDREYADIFVKETATAWSQVFILFLFANSVRTAAQWRQSARGLMWLAGATAAGGLIYALGLWRGESPSALGLILPSSLAKSSTFFGSIAVRGLAAVSRERVALFPARLTSLALTPTSLSLISLLLIPFTAWWAFETKGRMRWVPAMVLAGLLVCLAGAESRIAYLAFGAGLVALAAFAARSLRRPVRMALLGGAALLALLAVLGVVVGFGGLDDLWRAIVMDWRPGSISVRSRSYEETFRLLPQHPIAGWGVQVRIEGLRSSFSAGSHSSILATAFRHGLVGLVLYLGLWVSIWRAVIRGLKGGAGSPAMRRFWVAAAIALLGFNIRELADSWWWDQGVTMALWTMWGLTLTAPRSVGSERLPGKSTMYEEGNTLTDVWPSINLLGARLTLLDWDALLRVVSDAVAQRRKILVASGNVFSFNLAYEKPWFRDFLNRADLVRLEGEGLRWGARILGHETPARLVFADWVWDLAAVAAERGFTFFLLGARPGVAEKAADRLRERYPDLRVVGVHHGYFDKTAGSAENEAVIAQINAVKPNILFVGFGMPLQERWLKENWDRLDVNVAFTCGAMFDYVSGELRRAPKWMNDHGLEWLGRLIIEPRRLWRRYLVGNPLFMWRVLKQRIRQEMAQEAAESDGDAP